MDKLTCALYNSKRKKYIVKTYARVACSTRALRSTIKLTAQTLKLKCVPLLYLFISPYRCRQTLQQRRCMVLLFSLLPTILFTTRNTFKENCVIKNAACTNIYTRLCRRQNLDSKKCLTESISTTVVYKDNMVYKHQKINKLPAKRKLQIFLETLIQTAAP